VKKYKWNQNSWNGYNVDTLPDGVKLPKDFKFNYNFPKIEEIQEWVIENVQEIDNCFCYCINSVSLDRVVPSLKLSPDQLTLLLLLFC